ncbi:matrixin family metalloprotease [Aggregicoccus sp. 17bor-14]|uniref:myxosortase-dependent metalloprotease, MXAN_2677/MXAN_2678 family n=1 Tax=Myxococcaceae TaxID=31 RepID=UPI00129CFF02|nr:MULTISPECIES: myxosortase-dependent metalloprotease, MXAN_2677/MXAN_2678 family [Myxococcaceae]MBF5041415.1 matrixin family metalloprotease [Simulacricoccus sp. 17bor-14]MRI87199.1 matrixin family metalloprotease [Aggregicoccus sp. 17bor-14]
MSLASPAALALALALAQTGTAPYVRSRSQDTQYTPPACLYWTAPTLTWQQSTAGNPGTTGDTEFGAVSAAFQTWENQFAACGNLNLVEGARVADRRVGYNPTQANRNLVLFRTQACKGTVPDTNACWTDESCANTYDCWAFDDNVIGITTVSYDVRTGVIYDADIELNAARFNFTAVDSPCGGVPGSLGCTSTDIQNTVTHEAGHFIGLDHSSVSGSTMAPDARTGETSKRVLDDASKRFVCEVYPKGQPSVSCVDRLPTPEGSAGGDGGGGGCASGAGLAPSLLGALALLPLLRRRRARRA